MKKVISSLLLACVILFGCGQRTQFQSHSSPSSQIQESKPETQRVTEEFRREAEKYYDYFAKTNHISLLMQDDLKGVGFSDAEMSSFVLCELIVRNQEEIVRNGEPKEAQTAFPQEVFQQTAEKFFGKKIEKLENRMTTVLPENGFVTSTGWGGSMTRMVLQTLETLPDGCRKAEFLLFGFGIGEGLPREEQLKEELLSGKKDDYAAYPTRLWLLFEEKTDDKGELYLLYRDAEFPK